MLKLVARHVVEAPTGQAYLVNELEKPNGSHFYELPDGSPVIKIDHDEFQAEGLAGRLREVGVEYAAGR